MKSFIVADSVRSFFSASRRRISSGIFSTVSQWTLGFSKSKNLRFDDHTLRFISSIAREGSGRICSAFRLNALPDPACASLQGARCFSCDFFLTRFWRCIKLTKIWRILGRRGSRETNRPLPGNFERSSLTGRPGTPGLRVCSKWLRPSGLSRYAVPKLERVGNGKTGQSHIRSNCSQVLP